MPIQRGQPAPERQSVLSFVSPNVADLLFFETVDAKTVGAGTGVSISSATWAAASVSVPAGTHKAGFTVTVNTSSAHQFITGDVVTIDGLGSRENDSGYFRPSGTHKITKVDADTFTFYVREQPDASSPLDVSNNARVYLAHPSYGTAHPDTENFPRHKLCHVKQADAEGLFFEYYYAAAREFQDDYNFEFSQADLGGNEYDTVIRTYVNLRSDFLDTDTEYQAGDPMPDVPSSQFGDTYILMTRQQKRIGDTELDGLFVVEQRVYFKYEDKVSFTTDAEFNDELKTTEILAYVGKTSVPTKSGDVTWSTAEAVNRTNWGIKVVGTTNDSEQNNSDGAYNYEVQRLSNDWWKITEQQIVGENLFDGISYTTNQNYSYPAELIGFRFTLISRRDGTTNNSVTALEKDAFSGPILMTVNRQWYATAEGVTGSDAALTAFGDITTFKPRSGSYSGALFSLSYSNVLTKPFTLIDTVGTGHPTFLMGAYANNFFEQGSTPTAQPASGDIVNVSASSRPFRGGYLVETVTGVIP
tara:strand:- start:1191 stop:2777 length:1587 start_codon:yes stop_codon:yes gene_type:complete